MQTHTFVKEPNGDWFIDLPAYIANGGARGDLQMVAGADTMLDVIANGSNTVTITMADEPFDNADVIALQEVCDPDVGGGMYLLKSFEGKTVNQQMWLCAVTEFVFGYLPGEIFVK